jgi:hypothetical protein
MAVSERAELMLRIEFLSKLESNEGLWPVCAGCTTAHAGFLHNDS